MCFCALVASMATNLTVPAVPGVDGGEASDGNAVLDAVADNLTVPAGWIISPVAPINAPILLSIVPFVDDVKDKFVDKDPSDMSTESILNRSAIDTVSNLIGEEKMIEMVNDAASIGRMNKIVERCFCWGSCLPITCAPCFCCVHSMAQSKPKTIFKKWQEHMKTVPKVSADYNFELYFRPGNVWAALLAQNMLPYQWFFGFGFRPTDDAYQKILAEEAARKAKEAFGFKSEVDQEKTVAEGGTSADVENKEEDHWLVSALGLGSATPATKAEETSAATSTNIGEKAEPDVTVTENGANGTGDDVNKNVTDGNTNVNDGAGSGTNDDIAINPAPAEDGQVDNAQTTMAEVPKKKSWFGRNKKEKGPTASNTTMTASSGGEVVQPDDPTAVAAEPPKKTSWFGGKKKDKSAVAAPTVADTTTTSPPENIAPADNVVSTESAPVETSNDGNEYKVPPPKEEPSIEVKEEKKPTPQFNCGCT